MKAVAAMMAAAAVAASFPAAAAEGWRIVFQDAPGQEFREPGRTYSNRDWAMVVIERDCHSFLGSPRAIKLVDPAGGETVYPCAAVPESGAARPATDPLNPW